MMRIMRNRALGILMIQILHPFMAWSQPVDSMLNLDVIVGVEIAREIQSRNLETSPIFYENGIVFVYAREKARFIDPKIGMPYFELMYSDLGPDSHPRKAVSFSSNIRSRFHEGPSAFSNDFQQMYFTRSNVKNGQGVIDDDKKIRLKIFSAKKGLEDWENIEELPFCGDAYSTCHPAISEDGNLMVFSSDMPGGEGGMDLYVIQKVDGFWQIPINLGPNINTKRNELFPTLHPGNILFYSSNGRNGLGGLDIYATHLEGTSASGLIAMPSPFNSREDDLGLVVDESGQTGFVASARSGKKFKDDIFVLKMSENIFEPLFPQPIVTSTDTSHLTTQDQVEIPDLDDMSDDCLDVKSRIRKREDQSPIEGAILYFNNDCGVRELQAISDENGFASVCLKAQCRYSVTVSKDGFLDHEYEFVADPEIHETWNIFLDPKRTQVLDVETIEEGITIVLENIYYDFNKSAIQRGAAEELEELARVMRSYPSMKIQLAAHTDSRGTDAYNLELSKRRALAAKDFLIARGIVSNRITTVAKGESEIRNHCMNGVPCTESDHRYNRRTEVLVLTIDEPIRFQYGEGDIKGN